MSERNNKLELLGSAPIPKALMSLGVPIMIGMLINALYNLVDAYFVSGLGKSQMGAISIVFPLGQVVVGLGLMFGNGAASYLSRLLGRGDKDTANKVASTALYSSLLIGAIIILFSTIFLKPILTMLGATETIMPYALTYSRIYILSCVFNVFNVTMNNIVSSEGAAKTTMCALLLGAVLNIGLDPLFIYTFNMGVAGAAIATAISQLVSTLVYLTYILRKRSAFSFSLKAYCSSSYPKTAAGSHVWFSPACSPQDSLLSGLANLPFGFPFPVPVLSTRQRVCHIPHLTHWARCGYNTHPDNG